MLTLEGVRRVRCFCALRVDMKLSRNIKNWKKVRNMLQKELE